jgi:hypothetical protein
MEIKRTVLPPYGGSREEMGGGTSAWTYGRGVIGSPADGVVVPNLIGLTASQAGEALENVGLVFSFTNTSIGATEGNNGTVGSQSPNPGTLVNAGSTVAFSRFDYVAPAALVGPTNNWVINMGPMYFPEITTLPSELNTPTNYKLVLSGGDWAGEWPIASAYIQPMAPNILVIGFGMSDRPAQSYMGRIEGNAYTPPPGPPAGGTPLIDYGMATIVPV